MIKTALKYIRDFFLFNVGAIGGTVIGAVCGAVIGGLFGGLIPILLWLSTSAVFVMVLLAVALLTATFVACTCLATIPLMIIFPIVAEVIFAPTIAGAYMTYDSLNGFFGVAHSGLDALTIMAVGAVIIGSILAAIGAFRGLAVGGERSIVCMNKIDKRSASSRTASSELQARNAPIPADDPSGSAPAPSQSRALVE